MNEVRGRGGKGNKGMGEQNVPAPPTTSNPVTFLTETTNTRRIDNSELQVTQYSSMLTESPLFIVLGHSDPKNKAIVSNTIQD